MRTIPLPQVVVDALAAHLAEFPTAGLIFEPITRQLFSKMWRAAVMRAGLPREITYHSLRHYYASLLIRHGESIKTVQERLGHSSAVTKLNTYSRLWPDSDDRTRAAVDEVLRTSGTLCGPADALRSKRPAQRLCPGLPWQTLYFLPEPHGQGAFRAGSCVPETVAVLAAFAAPPSLAEESSDGAE